MNQAQEEIIDKLLEQIELLEDEAHEEQKTTNDILMIGRLMSGLEISKIIIGNYKWRYDPNSSTDTT